MVKTIKFKFSLWSIFPVFILFVKLTVPHNSLNKASSFTGLIFNIEVRFTHTVSHLINS